MQNGMVTKWLVASLLLVVVVQSIWTFTPDPKPELSQIMNRYPIGTQGSVYEVLSNSGGATVPMVYLYFIAARQSDNAQALKLLEDHYPFLVTKQPGAITAVTGLKITARTHDSVYRYNSTSLLREDDEIKPVTIDLTATSE
ncbi:hypothetical protein V0R50_17440 [Pseudomonas sp. 148P]|uniref:Uncharacterized protein n=1 Tax=Pseudomonas ulcerans TaxID=3115852 RepID=A0ABU7HTZ5_9PSED|nr:MULTISPECIES: hypothetical protein [unclassified Pseudomonas]MEE1925289.1 hypothetical protein [Pseudomonas sp. 147P]MEE1935015.1 hypothetical protein [Pseudomonas sp. 148P]